MQTADQGVKVSTWEWLQRLVREHGAPCTERLRADALTTAAIQQLKRPAYWFAPRDSADHARDPKDYTGPWLIGPAGTVHLIHGAYGLSVAYMAFSTTRHQPVPVWTQSTANAARNALRRASSQVATLADCQPIAEAMIDGIELRGDGTIVRRPDAIEGPALAFILTIDGGPVAYS